MLALPPCPPARPIRFRAGLGRQGLTLVEMLTVVMIIGMTTAFVMPKLDPIHFRIDAGMRVVGSALARAQHEAMARQHDVVVSVDTVARTLRLHFDRNNDHAVDVDERVELVSLDEGVVFGRPGPVPARGFGGRAIALPEVNGMPSVIFHRNGSANSGGGLYLTSARALAAGSNRLDDTRALEFSRSSGRASWYRYSGTWQRGF